MKGINIFLILAILIVGFFAFRYISRNSEESSSINVTDVEESPGGGELIDETMSCQVCGPEGLHNLEGNTCPEGFVCKQGITTTASYCVKEQEDVSICETAPANEYEEEYSE